MRFHIVKRDNGPFWQRCCYYVVAVLAALTVGAIVLAAIGVGAYFLMRSNKAEEAKQKTQNKNGLTD